MNSPRIVNVSGSYYEQGRQHGEQLAVVIAEVVTETLGSHDWHHAKAQEGLKRLRSNLERHAPGLLEELRGIAAGSGVPEERLWAYNCIADIWQWNAFCTNVAFAKSPDGPLIGKTNDIGRDGQRYHALFRRNSGDGGAMLWVTWPGTVWANCFVNGAGLAFGGTSVVKKVRNNDGAPCNILLRWLGDACRNVEEGVALLRKIPIMHHPANITLADKGGHLAVVEKSPDGCGVRYPGEDGKIFAVNCFCTSESAAGDPELEKNSQARAESLTTLMAAQPGSVERVKTVLASHGHGGVCQHGDNPREMWTTVAYVAVPARKAIHFAYGRPCETPFVEYKLD
ncbi:MAG TPA: C45 family peptidase [Planctomycetota bacterium]|nr:C45 family peptidase [Planctomycetota bacterium]